MEHTMITVTNNQSMMDVAIQNCGSFEAAFDLAMLNDISLTDDLSAGASLTETAISNNDVVVAYNAAHVCPATAVTTDEINEALGVEEGIEFWAIQIDFEVQ